MKVAHADVHPRKAVEAIVSFKGRHKQAVLWIAFTINIL